MVYMGQEEDHNLPKDSISNHFYKSDPLGSFFYSIESLRYFAQKRGKNW